MKQKNIVANNIEFQEIIGEAKMGSYRPIRFSRVKYKDNPNPCIDIRIFQRGYNAKGEEEYFPTKIGFQFLESEFSRVVKRWTILPEQYVHQQVMDKSFKLLAKRQFESAVLQSFKCIEIRIRERSKSSDNEVGIKLIRKAFDPSKGPLTDLGLPMSEREALANYIAGAYGYYKNPCSHRDVDMDFFEAFERIIIASNILKIVEKSPLNI